ncbi:MAG: carbohydrate binding domain-containing protein [Chloroflexota bacterium]
MNPLVMGFVMLVALAAGFWSVVRVSRETPPGLPRARWSVAARSCRKIVRAGGTALLGIAVMSSMVSAPLTAAPADQQSPDTLQNPSFETVSNGFPGSWMPRLVGFSDTSTAHAGGRSLRMEGGATPEYTYPSPAVTLAPNATYTLSGFVKLPQTASGLGVAVRYAQTSPTTRTIQSPFLKTAGDWTPISVTFTTPANPFVARLDVLWDLRTGEHGWMDELTLTCSNCGSGPTAVLPNPSFESVTNGFPTGWMQRAAAFSDTSNAHAGTKSLRMEGSPDPAYTYPFPAVALQPNATYTFSGWVKLPQTPTGLGVAVRYAQTSPTTRTIQSPFLKTAGDWTPISVTFTTPASPFAARLDILWDLRSGERGWVDDMSLTCSTCNPATGTPTSTATVTSTSTATPTSTGTLPPQPNLVKNDSFELVANGFPTSWQPRPTAFWDSPADPEDPNKPHSGGASLRVQGGPAMDYTLQTVDLNPGSTYLLSGWIKTSGSSRAGISIRWNQTSPLTITFSTPAVRTPTSWTQVTKQVKVPANSQGGRLDVVWDLAPGDVGYVDDVALVCTASCPSLVSPTPTVRPTSGTGGLSGLPTTNAAWTEHLFDHTKSNYNPNETALTVQNAPNLQLRWRAHADAATSIQPIVANGMVYWGAWDGYLRATRLADATPGATNVPSTWATYIGTTDGGPTCAPRYIGVASTPVVADVVLNGKPNSTLFLGGGDGFLYAVDAYTGGIIWKTQLGTPPGDFLWSSPLISNGSVYMNVASLGDCPLTPAKMYKLNAQTGQIQNVFEFTDPTCLGGGVWGTPALDDQTGLFYIATGTRIDCGTKKNLGQNVVVLRASDLGFVDTWKVPDAEAIGDGDFGAATVLFTATLNGVVTPMVGAVNKNQLFYAFRRNAVGAGPVWQREISDATGFAPAAWDGASLFVTGGSATLNGASCRSIIRAWDPSTSTSRWDACLPTTGGNQFGGPVRVSGLLVVANRTHLDVLNAATGALLYEYPLPNAGQFYGSPTVANGVIYVTDTNGVLYAFSP